MSDHNERACRYCGSLLHHEDVCGPGLAARAAYLTMAEECERRADDGAAGPGQRVCRPRCSPSTAAELRNLAAWARQKAGE